MVCPLGFQPSHNAFFYCLHLVRSYNGRLDSPPVIIFAIFCSLYQSNVLMNSHCFFDSLYICCKTLGTERVDPLMPSFPILNSFFLLPCLSPHSCNFLVSQLFHKNNSRHCRKACYVTLFYQACGSAHSVSASILSDVLFLAFYCP